MLGTASKADRAERHGVQFLTHPPLPKAVIPFTIRAVISAGAGDRLESGTRIRAWGSIPPLPATDILPTILKNEDDMLIEGLDYTLISGDEYNPYGREYKTLRDYRFFFHTTEVTIPAGYKWDGPSGVPYVGTINKGWLEPSLRHDFLYEEQGRIDGIEYTRQEVDELFFEGIRSNGVSVIYIWIMRYLLDGVFQHVWDDTSEGSTKVLKRYMVPAILILFALGAAVTTGAVFMIPSIINLFALFT